MKLNRLIQLSSTVEYMLKDARSIDGDEDSIDGKLGI
jgi:hypothetical protein